MSKAYQCDRCKKFSDDFVGHDEISWGGQDFELCVGCISDFKIFMTGDALPNVQFKGVIKEE